MGSNDMSASLGRPRDPIAASSVLPGERTSPSKGTTVDYAIDKDRKLVITTARGVVTFTEFRSHQDSLRSDPDFNPEFDQLLDATAVSHLTFSVDELKILAARNPFSPKSKRAIVATAPSVFGMGRMTGAYINVFKGSASTSVFYDLAAARDWLDSA